MDEIFAGYSRHYINFFTFFIVKFWGDIDGQKYHKAYFTRFENIWHHGDFIERTSNNGFIMSYSNS